MKLNSFARILTSFLFLGTSGCYLTANIDDLASNKNTEIQEFEIDLSSCDSLMQESSSYNCTSTSDQALTTYKIASDNTCLFASVSESGEVTGVPSVLDAGVCTLSIEGHRDGQLAKARKDISITIKTPQIFGGNLSGLRTTQNLISLKNSGDSLKIAFKISTQSNFGKLFLINSDGTGFNRIGKKDLSVDDYVFKSTSDKVYFTAGNQQLFVANVDGAGLFKISSGSEKAKFFAEIPGTDFLVYFDDISKQIYKIKNDGTGKIPLLSQTRSSASNAFKIEVVNGTHVIFHASQAFMINWLYTVPLDGSGETLLHSVPVANGVVSDYLITKDQQKVVFRGDILVDEKYELFAANIDGTGRQKLNPTLAASGDVKEEFIIANDSNKVVYVANLTSVNNYDLYSVNIDGTNNTKLTPTLDPGENVYSSFFHNCYFSGSFICNIKITEDSTKVVYSADQDIEGRNELYAVNMDGTSNVKISGSSVAGSNAYGYFYISQNANYVVFLGDMDTNNANELYSAKIDGSQRLKLNVPTVTGIGWNSKSVLFSSTANTVYLEFYESAAIGNKTFFYNLSDASRLELLGGEGTVFKASIYSSDKQNAIAIQEDRGALKLIKFRFDTSTQTDLLSIPSEILMEDVYNSLYGYTYQNILYSPNFEYINYASFSSIDSSTKIKKLNFNDGVNSTLVTIGGPRYLSAISKSEDKIFTVSVGDFASYNVDNSGVTILNQRTSGLGIKDSHYLSNGSIVFTNEEVTFTKELFTVNQAGGNYTRINAPIGSSANQVNFFKVTPDEQKIVYHTAEDGAISLKVVNIDNTNKINLALAEASSISNDNMAISPDSKKAAWYFNSCCTLAGPRVYVAKLDGLSPPTYIGNLVNPGASTLTTFKWFPDSENILIRSDLQTSGKMELYVAPIAPGAHTKISVPLVSGGNVVEYSISEDGKWVVYLADAEVDEKFELYVYKMDGSVNKKISGNMIADGDVKVGKFKIDSKYKYVVFIANKDSEFSDELYSVNLLNDKITKLNNNSLSASIEVKKFEVTESGRVFYISDEQNINVSSLYSVSLNGSVKGKIDAFSVLGSGVVYFKVNKAGTNGFYLGYSNSLQNYEAKRFSF